MPGYTGTSPRSRGKRMSVQAPAILAVETAATMGWMTWLRGIGLRQVRITCGLVMFSYIVSHFFNHALGNISYDLMEGWIGWHIWWWRNPVVAVVLYSAAT